MAHAQHLAQYDRASTLFDAGDHDACEEELTRLLDDGSLSRELRCRALILLASNTADWYQAESYRREAESDWDALEYYQKISEDASTDSERSTLAHLRATLDQLKIWQEEDTPENLSKFVLGGWEQSDEDGEPEATEAEAGADPALSTQEAEQIGTQLKTPQEFETPGSTYSAIFSQKSEASSQSDALSIAADNKPNTSSYRYGPTTGPLQVNRSRYPQSFDAQPLSLTVPDIGRGAMRTVSGRGKVCYNCHRQGHIARNCPDRATIPYQRVHSAAYRPTTLRPDASRPDRWFLSFPGARVHTLLGEHRVTWQGQVVGLISHLVSHEGEEDISGISLEARTAKWNEIEGKEVNGEGYVVDGDSRRLAVAIPDNRDFNRFRRAASVFG